jgi:(2Fe-2S) ferredoxin
MAQHRLLVCHNTTCSRQGAAAVLAGLRAQPVAGVTLERSGCLGQCGSGPMVLVLPEEIWYAAVQPEDVPEIIQEHLQREVPVKRLLYRKFHPSPKP